MSQSRSNSASKSHSSSPAPRPRVNEDVVKLERNVKPEHTPSPADSPAGASSPNAGAEAALSDLKLEPKTELLSDLKSESSSMSSTPAPQPPPKRTGPQLIGDLPVARKEALETFVELPQNHYQYNSLGRSREAMEGMVCDCTYKHGDDDPWVACGDGSDCINRLTQVECLPDECRCRGFCQNQRFRRKDYAPIEIVQTEKKGFGLRAEQNIKKDQFIYEYVGDVVSHPSFMKRMRDYAQEGIKHFYFMMLQKDEYIDATKRGGIGRFANHSCNPNCYVAKWTVGHHVRMGIFASRFVHQHEELTFNYNVDRYGHDAQPCYCGEPNCVGILGGKTQTDIGGMDDLYLDALGISEEVEMLGLKGTKKKKGKKLDEDYTPLLKPLVIKDVPKLIQAMRQTQSRKVLFKLLTRIKMTDDTTALRQLMRLRGFSMMTTILEDYVDDLELVTLALESMKHWPLLQRNKIEDSKVNVPVEALSKTEDEKIRTLAQELLDHWATLECAYRIPKRLKEAMADGAAVVMMEQVPEPENRPAKRQRFDVTFEDTLIDIVPLGTTHSAFPRPSLTWTSLSASPAASPAPEKPAPVESPVTRYLNYTLARKEKEEKELARIKAEAVAQLEKERQEAAAAQAKAEKDREAREAREAARRERKNKPERTAEEKETLKEKQLHKLISAVVIPCLSKYKSKMEVDVFKKHAKDLTQIIADKEKRSKSYQEGKLEELSEEKKAKIKKFAKEYIAKLLHRLNKKSKHGLPPPTDSANTSVAGASASTPDSDNEGDVDMNDAATTDEADEAIDEQGTPIDVEKASDPRTRTRGPDDGWEHPTPVSSIPTS